MKHPLYPVRLASAILLLAAGIVFARADVAIPLAGEWTCQLDPQDVGIKDGWANKALTAKVKLPGSLATNGLGEVPEAAEKGQLTPAFRYVGPAWYQRAIDIPADWSGRRISLHLERVLMRSTVWIDGQQTGDPVDFLGAPHEHDLGSLSPGRHVLSVRVDNRNVHNASLGNGHHYYDGMQTIWNGLVGRLELRSRPEVSLSLVRLFPSAKEGAVRAEITVENTTGKPARVPLRIIISEKGAEKPCADAGFTVDAASGKSKSVLPVKLSTPPKLWDEFTPSLYRAEIVLGKSPQTDTYRTDIGFRDLATDGYHLTINGRPFFYRNNHEGCMFPLTGYPPTDVESWRKILRIYKNHGLNGIRFHSWTPPEAAFAAADELGIYIQSEHFWNRMDATPEMAAYARREMRECLDRYGNHPSNCYVLYGNELFGDLDRYGSWLREDRAYDPRHLYSVAAGYRVEGDDFTEYGAKMNWAAPFTDWDYQEYFAKKHKRGVPETTHELGQPVTHPDWRELEKYTGVLKPRNLEKFRELARAAGVEDQSAAFQKASGNINRLNYKLDIEALLRTPQSAGYGLLDMHDYPGQGVAAVGWLDAFYESKGFLSASEFRQFGAPVVPLVRLPKFVFTDGETLTAKAEIANYGPDALQNVPLAWSLKTTDGNQVASGTMSTGTIPVGTVGRAGDFIWPVRCSSPKGERLVLTLSLTGTEYSNSWDLWVFPKPIPQATPPEITVTDDIKSAMDALGTGRKVLLLANRLGKSADLGAYACFKPPFWSTNYGFSQQSRACGAIVRDDHPALDGFPTDDFLDLQWQPLCADIADYELKPSRAWRDLPRITDPDARGFVLKDFPAHYKPIVQPVPDFVRPSKIGTIFEVKTKSGGRLLVCGYNISGNCDSRPVARQLRGSLISYMLTAKFNPDYTVDDEWVLATFEKTERPLPMPTGFEKAYFYVKAGGRHPTHHGSTDWKNQWDAVSRTDAETTYTVKGATTWADEGGTAWAGSKIRMEIRVKEAVSGVLKVRFHDWNRSGRRGTIRGEDNQVRQLGPHEDGQWIEFPLRREDGLDGTYVLEAETTAGPNLMITDVVITPR